MDELVYVMEAEGLGLFKIGVSRNPRRRLSDISTSSPVPIAVRLSGRPLAHHDAREEERALHGMLHTKRVRGEWFQLTEGDLEVVKGRLELPPDARPREIMSEEELERCVQHLNKLGHLLGYRCDAYRVLRSRKDHTDALGDLVLRGERYVGKLAANMKHCAELGFSLRSATAVWKALG
jgi:hypothetical protein